jgi:hypothetical protein
MFAKNLIGHCQNITDCGLKYLQGIENLSLNHNANITNLGLRSLIGIQSLSICHNPNITVEGLRSLQGIQVLRIYGCQGLKNTKIILKGCSVY